MSRFRACCWTLLTLTACAPQGAVRVTPVEGGDRMVLQAFMPGQVSCTDVMSGTLPAVTPLVEAESTAPDPAFVNGDLPSEPLTLVAVQYDGCARIGVGCVEAVPGQDIAVVVSESVFCPDGCALTPWCPLGCCTFDAAGEVTSPDCDGDGLLNMQELRTDADGDRIADVCDLDSDGDGLSDGRECDGLMGACTSLNGEPLYRDPDSDNDGVQDGDECCGWGDEDVGEGCDIDNDGVPAHLDPDTDGDGVFDAEEALFSAEACPDGDCDGDGQCNAVDVDSDGDGARDGRECDNPTLAASCAAPWDARQVRCDAEDVARTEFCGACCDPTMRCAGTDGPRINYCVPSDATVNRPEWSVPGGAGFGTTIPGTISLQALVADETPGSLAIPFDYPTPNRGAGVFAVRRPIGDEEEVDAADLLEELLAAPYLMTCNGSGEDRRCLAVFGLRATIPDEGGGGLICSILRDRVLVVADHFGHASDFDRLTANQQAIIGAFDRGYQMRVDGGSQPWDRQAENSINLMRPDTDQNCRGETGQFDFE